MQNLRLIIISLCLTLGVGCRLFESSGDSEHGTKGLSEIVSNQGQDKTIYLINQLYEDPGYYTNFDEVLLQVMKPRVFDKDGLPIKQIEAGTPVFKNPRNKFPRYGLCFWSMGYEPIAAKSVGDLPGTHNVARAICENRRSPGGAYSKVKRVTPFTIEVDQLYAAVNYLKDEKNRLFWRRNRNTLAGKTMACTVMVSVVSAGIGTAIGALVSAPLAGIGAAPGALIGLALSESLCEYFSATTMQQYDRLDGDTTLGTASLLEELNKLKHFISNKDTLEEASCDSFLCRNDLKLTILSSFYSYDRNIIMEPASLSDDFFVFRRLVESITLTQSLFYLPRSDYFFNKYNEYRHPKYNYPSDLIQILMHGPATQEKYMLRALSEVVRFGYDYDKMLLSPFFFRRDAKFPALKFDKRDVEYPNIMGDQLPYKYDAKRLNPETLSYGSNSFTDYMRLLKDIAIQCPALPDFDQLCENSGL